MKRNAVYLLLLFTISLLFNACQKYEDGPIISFLSRKGRIVNTWKVQYAVSVLKADKNEIEDITLDFEDYWLEFKDNGDFVAYTVDAQDSTHEQMGLWDLVNDDEEIRLLYTTPPILPDRAYLKILRLKDKELWVEIDQDTETLEIRYEPK